MTRMTMYPAVNGSIPTMVSGLLTATATSIEVANAGVLGPGPNLLTLGVDDNAEVVLYQAIEGDTVTGCVRGFGGTQAQIWPDGTPVCRAYTAYDHMAFLENIRNLETEKLSASGKGERLSVDFEVPEQRSGLIAGETLGDLIGKLARWYAAFGEGAWRGFGTGETDIARGNHQHTGYAELDADGRVKASQACAKGVDIAASRTLTAADMGRCLYPSATMQITLTLGTDEAQGYPDGAEIEIIREGTGVVRVQAGSGVTLCGVRGSKSYFDISNRYGAAVLKKRGANDWRIAGDVV